MNVQRALPPIRRSVHGALLAVLGALLPAAPVAAQDIIAYGRECSHKIAPIPAFDCFDGAEAPITVNGQTPASYQPHMTCDRPSLLYQAGENTDGRCVPFTRALVLRDDGQAQISAICRQKKIRTRESPLFDEVDIIAHSLETGSTCWFQAQAKEPLSPARGLNGRRVPPPDEETPPPGHPSARAFWNPPQQTAKGTCVGCHDSDPFMYSPFIAQTGRLPADPFGRYANDIGAAFRNWPKPSSISTRGNTCTSCHRMGSLETCRTTAKESVSWLASPGRDDWAKAYPQSHWMPPGNFHTQIQWEVIYKINLERILACCADPSQPECVATPITGGSAPLQRNAVRKPRAAKKVCGTSN